MRAVVLTLLGALAPAACTSPAGSECDLAQARAQRCGPAVAACEATDNVAVCDAVAARTRPSVRAASVACLRRDPPCGAAGDESLSDCVGTAEADEAISPAGQALLAAFCARCPSTGGAADAAGCMANISARPPAGARGAGSLTAGVSFALRRATDATIAAIDACFRASTGDPCVALALCLNDQFSPLVASSCPASSQPTGSCAHARDGLTLCTEFVGFARASGALALPIACETRDAGVWSMVPCPTGAAPRAGGCRRVQAGVTITTWVAAATGAGEAEVRALCARDGGTFVAP